MFDRRQHSLVHLGIKCWAALGVVDTWQQERFNISTVILYYLPAMSEMVIVLGVKLCKSSPI